MRWRVKPAHEIYTYRGMIHVSLLPGATLCENGRQKIKIKKRGIRKKVTDGCSKTDLKINKLSQKTSGSA